MIIMIKCELCGTKMKQVFGMIRIAIGKSWLCPNIKCNY